MDFTTDDLPVHRSSTRRKACSCCVKAKRRCDLTLPACARCRTRELNCHYVESRENRRSISSRKSLSQKFLQPSPIGTPSTNSTDSSASSPPMNWVEIDPMIESMSSPYASFPFPELGSMSTHQINYCVSQLKNWVALFVLENQTPFIHLLSYQNEQPLPYHDALSTCSLYMHRTPQNRDMVFRILDFKLVSLIQQSTFWVSAEDKLLGLQVLLLYQVIRVFDGDVRQRANAERTFELFDSWILQLHQTYFEVKQRPCNKSYQSWVLLESIRRTVMISILFRDLFSAMKDGVCELIPLMASLPVSNIGKLWNRADKDQLQGGSDSEFLVTYGEFTQAWNAGTVTDIEDYEKMLLVACRHAKRTGQFI